jgi:hypothetical protein
LSKKGTIIAVLVVAIALLVSIGVSAAAIGSGSNGLGSCTKGSEAKDVKAGNEYTLGNQGEDGEICNRNCTETQNSECNGDCDCDQTQLRDQECDGICDGDGAQNQSQNRGESNPNLENASLQGAGAQNGTGPQDGNCSGDCNRDQTQLRDQAGDGTCDGNGNQTQNRSCGQPQTNPESAT